MKDELGGKITTEFVTLRPKTYSYLTDDGKENKKVKGTKKCVIKKMIKFNDYKKCLLNDEVILKSQQRFISKKHNVYTENINKIALSNNDDRIVSNKKENKERNDWPFRMLIIGPSGSGKTNTLLHLINNFHPIDKIYLYPKDTDEKKYQYLINKREQAGIKSLNDPHAFIEYLSDMNDVLDDINNYNQNRDKKLVIIFDDMIADIMRSEKFKAIVK